MADTGANWGSWTAVAKSGGGDWTALDIADDANAGSGAISLDGVAAINFGVALVEDNTGAINGNVTVAILRDVDGTNYEDIPGLAGAQVGSPYKFQVLPVQNDTVYVAFALDAFQFGTSIKIWLLNEGGQTLTTTVKYQTATVPAAS
jgi:hypothetical protein